MSSVKKACICSLCTALCTALPIAFHALALGAAFSPMHLPVLLCGLLCGWPYGLFCGVAGPVIGSALTSMPVPVQLIYMVPEHAVYGLAAGLLMACIRTGRTSLDCLLTLVPAMLLGRAVGGACQAAFYLSHGRAYSLALWAGGYLVKTLPGAAMQLVLLPALAVVLMKAGLIPRRYPKIGEGKA